ncbi:MAG: nucleotide sugar dehydrogenase [Bdellovibrio sp.]|nr:MAG: nucleotide sugar dehydrogenase [Bdellovibrio sp.]
MEKDLENKVVISVVGLGYVGLPVAVSFGRKFRTIGFDVNARRIEELKAGQDVTCEVSQEELKSTQVEYTSNPQDLKTANFHIVAVPTPIDSANRPDLSLLQKASETVGQALKKGDIVVYESTVYPGATEEECAPILEKASGLVCGKDFFLGYSPERINPGDKEHRFTTILKVVSGQTPETLDQVAQVYESVVEAGVYRAPSIKVAEAAKVIENTQRDLNIAFMNELSLIFHRLGIDTQEVLKAASTKWNFLSFTPGLVGGHCIGVDPFYLTYKAESIGYHPEVILAGRRINDSMGFYVAQEVIQMLIRSKVDVSQSQISVLGLTFKENCPDLRNSKVSDIVQAFKSLGVSLQIVDPLADPNEVETFFQMAPTPLEDLKPSDALILASPHRVLVQKGPAFFLKHLKNPGVFADVKGVFSPLNQEGVKYWRL